MLPEYKRERSARWTEQRTKAMAGKTKTVSDREQDPNDPFPDSSSELLDPDVKPSRLESTRTNPVITPQTIEDNKQAAKDGDTVKTVDASVAATEANTLVTEKLLTVVKQIAGDSQSFQNEAASKRGLPDSRAQVNFPPT